MATVTWSFDRVTELRQGSDEREAHDGLTNGMRRDLGEWLHADVSSLLALAAALTGASRARLQWSSVHGERCPRLHIDHVVCGLICAYAGPGTMWLPDDAVDRAALAHALECPCDASRPVTTDPAKIRQAGQGHVLALRGAHDGFQGGAVHKSPPVGPGEARAVLVITVREPPR